MTAPQRTAPVSVVVGAIGALQNAIFPAVAAAFGTGIGGWGILIGLAVGAVATGIGTTFSYVGWRRLTYTIGEHDIRVESGILSRAARSVPYERIQDVSLEARPLPRLLGLVAVKFETGAGGGEDLALEYLSAAEGERLRQLVRERREEEAVAAGDTAAPARSEAGFGAEDAAVLFRMGPGRLLTFGLFEFSLAVFAVLGGALQYANSVTGNNFWNFDLWRTWLEEQSSVLASLGPYMQAAGAVAGIFGLIVIGMATGVIRTVLRDWGFVLERSARGFRRRRGLLTRTDVVMPAHRVQALVIGTGMVRYRFGWRSLSFVSLAQDAEGASHVVAPFAQMEEIAGIVTAAGFSLPDERAQWHRASERYRNDRAAADALGFLIIAVPVAIFAPFGFALIPVGLAVLAVGANLFAWEFQRHALDDRLVFAVTGVLAPTSMIGTRLKLHSVELRQGIIARARGYATVHFGLAGGTFAIPGVPLARARALRAAVLESIATTDYSRLDRNPDEPTGDQATDQAPNQALSAAQSGLSPNLLAT